MDFFLAPPYLLIYLWKKGSQLSISKKYYDIMNYMKIFLDFEIQNSKIYLYNPKFKILYILKIYFELNKFKIF